MTSNTNSTENIKLDIKVCRKTVSLILDNSVSYKQIFKGTYDRQEINGVDDPVCRLCLNYVVSRSSSSNRYSFFNCIYKAKTDIDENILESDESKVFTIPFCDKCGLQVDEMMDEYTEQGYKVCIVSCNKGFRVDSVNRANL